MFTFIIKIWSLRDMFHLHFLNDFSLSLNWLLKLTILNIQFKETPSLSLFQSCQSELSTAIWWFRPQHFLLVCLFAFRRVKARQKSGLTFLRISLSLCWRICSGGARSRLGAFDCGESSVAYRSFLRSPLSFVSAATSFQRGLWSDCGFLRGK